MKKRKIIDRTRAKPAWLCLPLILLLAWSAVAQEPVKNGYVGEAACQPCHEKQFESFHKLSKKSHSYESVQKMAKGLPFDKLKVCFGCHTTGYGKPGGFISLEKTPDLQNAGCEVCHGPGKLHVATESPDQIRRRVTLEVCRECHIEDRARAFRYKPKIYAGSH
jgi:hypothetical protein